MCPRLTAAMILLGSAVHLRGFGIWLVSAAAQMIGRPARPIERRIATRAGAKFGTPPTVRNTARMYSGGSRLHPNSPGWNRSTSFRNGVAV
jgi:hypothetical protein